MLLVNEQLPQLVTEGGQVLKMPPRQYPHWCPERWVTDIGAMVTTRINSVVESVVSFSVSSLPSVMDVLIFLVLLPPAGVFLSQRQT